MGLTIHYGLTADRIGFYVLLAMNLRDERNRKKQSTERGIFHGSHATSRRASAKAPRERLPHAACLGFIVTFAATLARPVVLRARSASGLKCCAAFSCTVAEVS